jgi:hypothetical protein
MSLSIEVARTKRFPAACATCSAACFKKKMMLGINEYHGSSAEANYVSERESMIAKSKQTAELPTGLDEILNTHSLRSS